MTAARTLRCRLEELFAVSTDQLDALDRGDLNRLSVLADEKERLLGQVSNSMDQVRGAGCDPLDPATYPLDRQAADDLRSSGDLFRRYQAHEKYVLDQVVVRRNEIGRKLAAQTVQKLAVGGYRPSAARGRVLDRMR